jgi:catechol 2,3-dioxygenase-like lactoylglutathione lyase family enzyme
MASAGLELPQAPPDTAVRFHISLNVACLDKAIAFYRVFLGVEPAKRRPDYAKFELSNPPLVLSMHPARHGRDGQVNHLGFRVPNDEMLMDVQRRLETAGYRTRRQDGVECCYARQTKFWVTDPDGSAREIYVPEEDIDHHGSGLVLTDLVAPARAAGCWLRALGRPFAALRCLLSGGCKKPAAAEPPAAAPH